MYNPFSLEGKRILVTGASSGIGRAIAIECSRLGAAVAITGRNAERLQETLGLLEGEGHQMLTAELTDGNEVEQMVTQLSALDGVVHCAGRGLTVPVKNAKRKHLEQVFDVNFFAPVELLQALLAKKKLNKPASVVVIASVGGNYLFEPGNVAYGATKAALNSYVRFAASELACRETRVNAVCPGMVDTPLIHRGIYTEEQLQEDAAKYPLKRYGQPADVAHAVAYLLSDAASWVTGTSLIVDGGISINKK